jgi:hypothetical protein
MRIKRLPLIVSIVSFLALSSFIAFYPTGAPPAKTGSPGDGSNCTECHGGTATTVSGWITSNIPADGYTPGQVYQITANNQITGSGKFGFEVSPQNVAGDLLGTLTAGANNQLVGANKYVTHTNANTTISTWTFSWTAPAAGTGQVTFYGAFAKGKPGPVRLSTLTVNEASVSPPSPAGPISGPSSVCKNNSYNYSVGTIAGATTYVWSVPTGATIVSGQGTMNISVNFGASANSGNVSVYGSNAGGNGAPSNLAVTVNTVPAQPSSITGEPMPCEGSSQAYSVTNVSGVSYNWIVPAGSTITSGQGTNSILVTIGNTSGIIEVVPSNSCGNGSGRSISISVDFAPGQAVQPMGPDVVDLSMVTESNYLTEGTGNADSYLWEISPASAGTITGTSTTATVSWNAVFLGMAEIRVKAINSCGEGIWSLVKQTQVINTTGIGDDVSKVSARIYPNPSNGKFILESNWNNSYPELSILNASGKEVHNSRIDGNNAASFDIPLQPGVYLMILSDGERTEKLKLMIQ